MSKDDNNLSGDELMGAGCLLVAMLWFMDLAVSICVGGLLGRTFGFAFHFGSIGVFCLFLLIVALKGGAK